ncbi:5-dehydro-2-deoxygluconokinase OS=Streptomyces microflavus OX=1919 GN=iolC PE=3 SV=1 [Streptomyces microflavus]
MRMPEPYDVITMGRIGVDIYPLDIGVPLARVETFGKFLGGSPTNIGGGGGAAGTADGGDHPDRTGRLRGVHPPHQELKGLGG